MYGLLFNELKNYLHQTQGARAWTAVLADANLAGHFYFPMREYPDVEMYALLPVAARLVGTTEGVFLEAWGVALAPTLLGMYRPLLKPAWGTLELLEHTEGLMHAAVRVHHPSADPPYLQLRRLRADAVQITYTSPRRWCALARGIVHGVAAAYQETVTIRDLRCMLRGAPSCEIVVERTGSTLGRGDAAPR